VGGMRLTCRAGRLVLLTTLLACSTATAGAPAAGRPSGQAQPPPGEAPAERFAAGVREISALPGVRSVVVVADGEVVVAEGFSGGDPARAHNLKSASKSVLSTLVGIALDDGTLPGLDATLGELLPASAPEGRRGITLRHLLTQTTGLESTSGEHYGAWVATEDWTRSALARPMLSAPGETFRYSTGNTHLVAAVLARATGEDLLAYARRVLFAPLGIGEVTWETSPEGVRLGGNQLSMTPLDFARFGWMVLQDGMYKGKRVVPATFLAAATRRQVETTEEWAERYGDYGYLWWVPRGHGGAYVAVGYGGQVMYVAPGAGVVVVVTSTLEGKGAPWDGRLFSILAERFGGPAAG